MFSVGAKRGIIMPSFPQGMEERLRPGTSKLVTVVEEASIERLTEALADLEESVIRSSHRQICDRCHQEEGVA